MLPSQILSSESSRLGIVALERGDLAEAEKKLEYAVNKNKNDINHRRHYAEVLWQQGKHQESLQQLDEAVKRGGHNDASLYISLAEKYLAIRHYETAYNYADEAIRLKSRDGQTWALRGKAKRLQALHQAGYTEHSAAMLHQAREDYLRAVSLLPNDRELLAELATLQMNCDQPQQALATWLNLQNMYPHGSEPAEVLLGKTETLTLLQRFDEAEANLQTLMQRRPENADMEQRLQRAMIAVQGNALR
jgi:tetratricopeptide (TPR) repeat protein